MNDLIEYKPLTEAITYSGDKYYKSCTPEQFFKLRAENESLFFDVSKKFVASAHIKEWNQADPEDVAFAWETQEMNAGQKRMFEASKSNYLKFWGGSKPLTNEIMRRFAEEARKGVTATFGR